MPEVWEGGNEAEVCLRYGRVGTRMVAKCLAYKRVIVCQKDFRTIYLKVLKVRPYVVIVVVIYTYLYANTSFMEVSS